MNIKTSIIMLSAIFASCKAVKSNNEAAIQSLNEQSLKCISIMNQADAKKTSALNAGDGVTASAMQRTMDSAALENAKIGQQLMTLQPK
jgi:hypothetical protein